MRRCRIRNRSEGRLMPLPVKQPRRAPRTLAISLTRSSLERDFYRRRQMRKKGARGDVSKQRPEIGDHDAREMAAKTAFVLSGLNIQVSEDWVVADAVRGEPVSEPKFPVSALNRDFLGKIIDPAHQIMPVAKGLLPNRHGPAEPR